MITTAAARRRPHRPPRWFGDVPVRPPMAQGALMPAWPLLDLKPRFKPDSFMRQRVGDDGRLRFHAGMDLPAPEGTVVVAPENGRILKSQTFNGPRAHALLLETSSGLVINLGEVEPDSWTMFGVGPGSPVWAGQAVATVGVNPGGDTMLHIETYRAGTRKTSPWYQDQGPPPSLLDPTDYILRAALRPVSSTGTPIDPVNLPKPKQPPASPPPAAPPAAPARGGEWLWIVGLGAALLLARGRSARAN
jgi:murein DD-endopeptidase MepM/ murein hydrolase activator NlpD